MNNLMKLICIPALVLSVLLPLSATGAEENKGEKQKSVKTKLKEPSKKDLARKKIGVDQSDFMPSENSFGLITSYSLSYDDLQQEDQKSVNHRIGFAGTYSFSRALSTYGALSVSHQTQDEKIVRQNDNDQYHGLSNLNVGAVYSFSPKTQYIVRSSSTLNVSLPLSERSQVDKHVASLSITNFMVSPSWNKLSLFSRVQANYLWNTLKFSIINNDQLNRDWLVAGSLGVNYQVLNSVGIRVSGSADNVKFLDGSWENSFGNRIAIFSNISGFQVFASLSNYSYPENERVDISFYDKYRRTFTFGVTHVF